MHRRSPEVVEKHVLDGRVWPQVAIFLDGADVVEHEATVETVVVAQHAHQRDQRTVQMMGGHLSRRDFPFPRFSYFLCALFLSARLILALA